ncbi:MAG: DUF3127 domain-containing protein [Planctomycetota bacterium]
MSQPTVRGIVCHIEETKTYGQKGFRKRLVVLEQESSRFTNYVPVEFIQDGCDTVDELKVGDDAEITYRLSGRKWQRDAQSEVKYFLNAEALSFRVLSGAAAASPAGDANSADVNAAFDEGATYDENDIPF